MKTKNKLQEYYDSKKDENERLRISQEDPQIKELMHDPRIIQTLKLMQENPVAAQGALKDPFIKSAINKLIIAGIINIT